MVIWSPSGEVKLQDCRPLGKAAGPTGRDMLVQGRGRQGTARVVSHDAIMIPLEVYDFNLASPGSPSARTMVP